VADDLVLQFQQERLGLGQHQAQLLQPLVLLGQHNQVIDGHLLVIIGDDHELKLEVQPHAGDSTGGKIWPQYPAPMRARKGAPPICHALPKTLVTFVESVEGPRAPWLRPS
jgi:hypothetical protein